jgi:hypothetical protein
MKIVSWDTLVDEGGYSRSPEFQRAASDLEDAITDVVWPRGSSDFAIYPESGKARGAGNGVVPIKNGFAASIEARGWELERRAPGGGDGPSALVKGSRPGAFDAHLTFDQGSRFGPFVAEWETGNISSSHRAINRIGLGIKIGYISGGVLILPSGNLAPYLTDRIGNEPELRPYHSLWSEWRLAPLSYFAIVAIEHDRTAWDVPRLPKGSDGRAIF